MSIKHFYLATFVILATGSCLFGCGKKDPQAANVQVQSRIDSLIDRFQKMTPDQRAQALPGVRKKVNEDGTDEQMQRLDSIATPGAPASAPAASG